MIEVRIVGIRMALLSLLPNSSGLDRLICVKLICIFNRRLQAGTKLLAFATIAIRVLLAVDFCDLLRSESAPLRDRAMKSDTLALCLWTSCGFNAATLSGLGLRDVLTAISWVTWGGLKGEVRSLGNEVCI
jgi:hypothetical protein